MLASDSKSLLPESENRPFTLALAAAFGGALDDGLKAALTISTAPEAMLPHLAVQEGVALWFDDWDTAPKRLAITTSLPTRSMIGTLPALHAYLSLVDATIIDRALSFWVVPGSG